MENIIDKSYYYRCVRQIEPNKSVSHRGGHLKPNTDWSFRRGDVTTRGVHNWFLCVSQKMTVVYRASGTNKVVLKF